ncbi:thiopeptide-type bacteriocin biosynthesis protein [Labedaea rhizosphaerae]|uniref:Thiopeptide-type bacteriocin biosynthesis protein n=1 Tax=Labedaea rhizosphaerae TaxID=598644 RepID=A0A4R6SF92_LABRH|nr:thiopeptide-type bacteriocin biosynthesis protein [Labedaea rhizosphaerae]TDQ00652.1 thiopeptide-type bacteriocin biosynthesis protein [Labedaea rhizosphaerae]
MSADQLTTAATTPAEDTTETLNDTVTVIETAVGHVLTGTSLAVAATAAGIDATSLRDAVEVYRQAGRRALHEHANPGWWQVYLRFADWDQAEHTARTHLLPLLNHARNRHWITDWWFIRKHPCWRLRLQPGPAAPTTNAVEQHLVGDLDKLTHHGHIHSWWPGIYEPETAAFGGDHAMNALHSLFSADSHAILTHLGDTHIPLGRRELTLLLCSTLMRAARLEWHEQGDVWHRITQSRPLPSDIQPGKVTALANQMKSVLLADLTVGGSVIDNDHPLAAALEWVHAFRHAGIALGAAALNGTLQRGIREIMTYLVIFHWNRLGLDTRTQAILAAAARAAILDT